MVRRWVLHINIQPVWKRRLMKSTTGKESFKQIKSSTYIKSSRYRQASIFSVKKKKISSYPQVFLSQKKPEHRYLLEKATPKNYFHSGERRQNRAVVALQPNSVECYVKMTTTSGVPANLYKALYILYSHITPMVHNTSG